MLLTNLSPIILKEFINLDIFKGEFGFRQVDYNFIHSFPLFLILPQIREKSRKIFKEVLHNPISRVAGRIFAPP